MTSGLEIIGVVLAFYPIVVDAWQAYKAAKSGIEINQMVQRLKTEQIIFYEFVHHLVGSSISEAERACLNTSNPRDVNGCWKDPALELDLKMRLGYVKMQNILTIVGNIHTLLKSMSEELPGIGRAFVREHTSLSSIKYLRPSKYLPQASLKRNLDILREYNHDLERLLGVLTLPGRAGRPKRRSTTLRYLRRDVTHALDIYNAICNGYKCDCDKPHFANLKLPRLNSLEAESEETFEYDGTALQLLFSVNEDVVSAPSSNSATLDSAEPPGNTGGDDVTSKNEEAFLEGYNFWTSPVKDSTGNLLVALKRERRTSQISICECPDEQCNSIDDLCEFVRAFDSAIDDGVEITEEDLGILCSEQKRFRIHAPRSSGTQSELSNTGMTLQEFLSNQSARKRERMRLALELSYAILQYYSTGWINTSWTWRDFSVTGTEGQDPAESQLFVTTKFYSVLRASNTVPTSTSSALWTLIGEPILTRLGFALIELAMGKGLSEFRGDDASDSIDSDTLDYLTARKILESASLMAEQGSSYEAVVRACLDHQFYCQTKYKRLDSRQTSFHQDVEESVIAPLHSMWVEMWQ